MIEIGFTDLFILGELSITYPKYPALNEGSILWSPTCRLKGPSLLNCCLVPMTMTPWPHVRKSRMHSSIARSTSFYSLLSSALKLRYSCVSSAKQGTCGRWHSITLNSEEVQMTNSKGPGQEPWGTPHSSENCLESDPSMETHWLRFNRYELNQSSTFTRMPTSLRCRSNKIP